MGPGPSDVPHRVLEALARPTLGHLDPVFLALMDRLRDQLRQIFRTENELTLAVSGTGSAGMETLFVNLVEPGDKVLVGVNGVFGGRMAEVARRCGAEVFTVEAPWGRSIDRDELIDAAKKHRPRLTALVHAETSTGVAQPMEGLGAALHELDSLFLVDCVTSLSGMPVEVDGWEIDAAYSGSQKCLSCPPGLAPITLSPRAVARMDERKVAAQSWYLDLSLVRNYWGGARAYHHTAPTNMLVALSEAAEMVLQEGLQARWDRHQAMHEALAERLTRRGLSYVAREDERLCMLNAVSVDAVQDEATIRRRLLEEYGIEIGGGLGAFKGKAWRIGLMGSAATLRNIALLDAALEDLGVRG